MEKTRDNYFNNHLCDKNIWKIQLSMRLMDRNTIMSQQMIITLFNILYIIIYYTISYYIIIIITYYYYIILHYIIINILAK